MIKKTIILNIKLHMNLVTGLMGLLYKFTGNTDIIIGVPIYKQEIEGEFINTVLKTIIITTVKR